MKSARHATACRAVSPAVVLAAEQVPVADQRFSREFVLAAACCRWPLSAEALAAIRSACEAGIDWPHFLRVVKRQRIWGHVHQALQSASIAPPPEVAGNLTANARRITRRNMALLAETVRLQKLFDASQIPVVVLKGTTIAKLAYGSIAFKHSKDIDLLVTRAQAQNALRLLENEGYALTQPAEELSALQRESVIQFGREVGLFNRSRRCQVELRWQMTENPLLFAPADLYENLQTVPLLDGNVRTFADDNLFAYLCVHGAQHGWSRLKWLADLNAWIGQKSEIEVERLYRYAGTIGSGPSAALSLCRDLMGLNLPASIDAELKRSRRVGRLRALAVDVMTGPDGETEMEDRRFGTTRVALMQFLLGDSWQYILAQFRA